MSLFRNYQNPSEYVSAKFRNNVRTYYDKDMNPIPFEDFVNQVKAYLNLPDLFESEIYELKVCGNMMPKKFIKTQEVVVTDKKSEYFEQSGKVTDYDPRYNIFYVTFCDGKIFPFNSSRIK